MKISKFFKVASAALLLAGGLAHAQDSGLSYGGYSIGYMNVSRTGMADANGIVFSGSFKLSESIFAAGQIAALSGLDRGRIGLGYRHPVAQNTDVFVIGSLARNTGFAKDWGSALGVGINTLIVPKLQAQLMSTRTSLRTNGSEQETSVGLSYTFTKDLALRARAMSADKTHGYEISIGSSF